MKDRVDLYNALESDALRCIESSDEGTILDSNVFLNATIAGPFVNGRLINEEAAERVQFAKRHLTTAISAKHKVETFVEPYWFG